MHCALGLDEVEVMPYGGSSGLAEDTLRLMAVVYKDRPGYVASWAPDGR